MTFQSNRNNVTITDIDIPFNRMVAIMLKLMVAAIPAVILFYALFFAVEFVVATVLAMAAPWFTH